MRTWLVMLVALVLAPACDCGAPPLLGTPSCKTDPSMCDAGTPFDAGITPPVDAGTPPVDAGTPPQVCDTGSVAGRVCATDQQTWVNGATVSIDATDCNGQPVHVETVSAADGSFTLNGVPPGDWTVHAALGAFAQDTPVSVFANQTTQIPPNQLCVAQKNVKIAVVTGPGDKIEDILTSLNLQYTTYGGDSTTWSTEGAPFLSSLSQMEQYDLIFVDCAAARSSGKEDFGPSAAEIEANLRAYVQNGGSLYASDWALLFVTYAAPGGFDFLTSTGAPVSDPQATNQLMGYAPQTVTGTIVDPGLASFLGKQQVSINFPRQSGVSSLHWGLMQSVGTSTTVLVSTASVQTCDGSSGCNPGPMASNIPLAALVKVTPKGQRGGEVVYTSFHNIAQSGTDVAKVLKYIILNL